MKNKYGVQSTCKHCGNTFTTRVRFVDYCSTPCKNPINRPGHTAWNKGIKLTEEQKSKQNISGLKKGHGWNKGLPNEIARQRMSSDQNPNKGGAVNAKRKLDGTLSFPGEKNGMWKKKHSEEIKEICRQAKIKNFKDGIYASSVSNGELELLEMLREKLGEVVHQFTVPNYHRVYDFYIPSLNLIVEYDGDYWHREEKYLNKDSRDTTKALKKGFKIFRYWESTVKQLGVDNIVEDIVKLKGEYVRKLKET
jgi:very-short-patch-repair endonuclease